MIITIKLLNISTVSQSGHFPSFLGVENRRCTLAENFKHTIQYCSLVSHCSTVDLQNLLIMCNWNVDYYFQLMEQRRKLLHWISPVSGKVTGTCVCCFSHVGLFVTLWTVAPQAPLSMGFSRQECWQEWGKNAAMPSSRRTSWPRNRTRVSYVSYIVGWVLYH